MLKDILTGCTAVGRLLRAIPLNTNTTFSALTLLVVVTRCTLTVSHSDGLLQSMTCSDLKLIRTDISTLNKDQWKKSLYYTFMNDIFGINVKENWPHQAHPADE